MKPTADRMRGFAGSYPPRMRFGHVLVWAVPLAVSAFLAPCCSGANLDMDTFLYSYTVIAQTDGTTLTGINGGPSVNDDGLVAFSTTVPGGQSIFANPVASATARNITPGGFVSSRRTFSNWVRINDNSEVVAQDVTSGSPAISIIRSWSALTPDSFTIIDESDSTYSSLVVPTINNYGQAAYLGIGDEESLLSEGPLGSYERTVSGIIRPVIADDGTIVGQEGISATSPIRLYSADLSTFQEIADSTTGGTASGGFSFLDSLPGISASGQIVVFQGNQGNGPGIFANVAQGDGTRRVLHIAGENQIPKPELGTDDDGNILYLMSFPTFTRVGVMHQQLDAAGLADDCFIVCFCATPNAASCTQTANAFFSQNLGIWTVRVDVTVNTAGQFQYTIGPPKPVVQVGDTIGGREITSLSILDPIARALTDASGNPRTETRGDHRIAFTASTAATASAPAGEMVVRADHTILRGFDISGANIIWDSLVQARAEFLIVDTWGGRGRFTGAEKRLANAVAYHVPVAAYLLLNFDTANEGGDWQVKQALSTVGSQITNLAFMALDVEYDTTQFGYDVFSQGQNAQRILDALTAISNHGLKPVIYTRQGDGGDWGAITGTSGNNQTFASVPLWLEYKNDGMDNLMDPGSYVPNPPWTTGMRGKQYSFNNSCEVQVQGSVKTGNVPAPVDEDVFDSSLFDQSTLPPPLPQTGCAIVSQQLTIPQGLRGKGPVLLKRVQTMFIDTTGASHNVFFFSQRVTVSNNGADTSGDVSLVLTGLDTTKSWLNYNDITSCMGAGSPPVGSPYMTIISAPNTIAAGKSLNVTLQFAGPDNIKDINAYTFDNPMPTLKTLTWNGQILEGAGQR